MIRFISAGVTGVFTKFMSLRCERKLWSDTGAESVSNGLTNMK